MRLEALERLAARQPVGGSVGELPALEGIPAESQLCVAQVLLARHTGGHMVIVPDWRRVGALPVEVRLAFLALEPHLLKPRGSPSVCRTRGDACGSY